MATVDWIHRARCHEDAAFPTINPSINHRLCLAVVFSIGHKQAVRHDTVYTVIRHV